MGYPLVPGYEAVGEVVESRSPAFKTGDRLFVPGASCFGQVRGLFGGAASHLVTSADRVVKIDRKVRAEGTLLGDNGVGFGAGATAGAPAPTTAAAAATIPSASCGPALAGPGPGCTGR